MLINACQRLYCTRCSHDKMKICLPRLHIVFAVIHLSVLKKLHCLIYFSLKFISWALFLIPANLPNFHFSPPSVVLGHFALWLSVQHPGENLGVPWLLKSDVHHHLSFSAWPSVWMHWLLQAALSSWTHSAARVLVFGHLLARDVSTHAFCTLLRTWHNVCLSESAWVCLLYNTSLALLRPHLCVSPLSTVQNMGWALGGKINSF